MKAGSRRNRGIPTREERGIALLVALWVMVLLSILGATFLSLSATESTIASNEVGVAKTFNIAEAGLERGKARVKTGTEPLNDFLGAGPPGPNLFTDEAFDGGTYTAVVEDDNDDLNQNTDINNRVFIRATGKFNNSTVQKQLVALVEVVRGVLPPPIPGPRGAGEAVVGPGMTWEVHADPGGSFDGRDWTAPANIAACTDIAGCGTQTGGAVTHGGFANTNAGSFDLSGGGTMFGTDCLPPSPCTTGATASNDTNTSVPLNRWDSVIDAAIANADRTLTVNGAWNTGTVTWGTAGAPEITVINNTTSGINWSSVVNGAGILIIESTPGSSGTFFQAGGQLNWEGLVIIRSPGTFQFEIANSGGRVRVFGQVVNRAATRAEIELNNGGTTSFIKYSTAGMGLVTQSFGPPPSFTLLSWQEVGM